MSRQTNVNHFPFAFDTQDDDSAIASKWANDGGAFELLDSGFDGPDAITADDLDPMIYGAALVGLV
jgi:hypothetical protein